MSNERDELALAMREKFSGWMGPAVSYDVADAVLAAGYRKPKHIPAIEALDAVIEDALEDARYLVATDTRGRPWIIWDDEDGCVQVSSWPQEEDPERLTLADIHLPARVLNDTSAL